jgi:Uma2 family endonuclease
MSTITPNPPAPAPSLPRPQQWTEEQLLALPDVGHKIELVDGRLTMAPAGFEHGNIGAFMVAKIELYARQHKLGLAFDSSTGFWMKSGNLRSPDASFVSAARLKGLTRLPTGFFQGSPDLAVEILSPSDRAGAMHERLLDYFETDTRLAWVINPAERSVLIYHGPTPDRLLNLSQSLDGEQIIPGFSLPLAEIFATPDFG